uniref:Uncharacterized protein n=1 Tax=viral metagenome TaxID=1070528 RepID=A0A6C0BLQ9_9ZZZZ
MILHIDRSYADLLVDPRSPEGLLDRSGVLEIWVRLTSNQGDNDLIPRG